MAPAPRARIAMARAVTVATVGLIGLGLSGCGSSSTAAPQGGTGPTNSSSTTGSGSSSPAGSSAPSAALSAAVVRALDNERLALATYRNVIATLGPVAPFTNVAASEQQHVATVEQLARRYGITVPSSSPTAPASPATRTAACALGVSTEQGTISLYASLLPTVSSYPDATTVFTQLSGAARDSHLPAFEHCA